MRSAVLLLVVSPLLAAPPLTFPSFPSLFGRVTPANIQVSLRELAATKGRDALGGVAQFSLFHPVQQLRRRGDREEAPTFRKIQENLDNTEDTKEKRQKVEEVNGKVKDVEEEVAETGDVNSASADDTATEEVTSLPTDEVEEDNTTNVEDKEVDYNVSFEGDEGDTKQERENEHVKDYNKIENNVHKTSEDDEDNKKLGNTTEKLFESTWEQWEEREEQERRKEERNSISTFHHANYITDLANEIEEEENEENEENEEEEFPLPEGFLYFQRHRQSWLGLG